MGMAYSVYRVASQPVSGELLLTDEHGFWLNYDGPEFVLKPDELIIQFLDRSVDLGIHNRTRIHRYSFAREARRLDPVAFQPQDFAEKWLTRDWREMESRSAPDAKSWHDQLHGDSLWADYSDVVACTGPDRWLIALDIRRTGNEGKSDPPTTYFLVHDQGSYTYSMEAVSTYTPIGCAGEGSASDKHPWLSTAELKALR